MSPARICPRFVRPLYVASGHEQWRIVGKRVTRHVGIKFKMAFNRLQMKRRQNGIQQRRQQLLRQAPQQLNKLLKTQENVSVWTQIQGVALKRCQYSKWTLRQDALFD